MMRVAGPLFVSIAFLRTGVCFAAELAYDFTGTIFQSSSTFGHQAPSGLLTGRFVFDPLSSVTHSIAGRDAAGYRQIRSNGFRAIVGNLLVQADDYIVEIDNDRPQPFGGVADILTIRFASSLDPPLEKPLLVNGTPQTIGLYSISFSQSSGVLFHDSSLPSSISLGDFDFRISILGDTPTGGDVLAMITTLIETPLAPGDYDFDGDIDGVDFLTWQRGFGSNDLAADGNDDNVVDQLDLAIWTNQFGANNETGASRVLVVVAEPATASLLVVLLGPGSWGASRRWRR